MTTSFNCLAGVINVSLKFLFLILLLVSGGCSNEPATPGAGNQVSEHDIALNNKGVALMGRFEYRSAGQVFAELVERHPQWHEVRTNFAIALKNRQQVDDGKLALQQLAVVLDAEPENVRANYNAGVLQLYLGQIEPAAGYFEATLAVDPDDAYAHYYLGQCRLRLGDTAAALASYQKAIELDPYLRSAYYSAAQVLRRLGDSEEASRQLAIFQRFDNNPAARLAEFKYTRMGPKSLALAVDHEDQESGQPDQSAAIPVGPIFDEKRVLVHLEPDEIGDIFSNSRLTTVDLNQDGAQDLFLAAGEGAGNRVLLAGSQGAFSEQANHPWQNIAGINAVAWGDIDNDGLVDAYLCRSGANQLWLQSEPGEWQQAGPEAGVGDAANDCADATMVDADHDGDLDILVGNRAAADNLLNNNRDGTFRSLADKLGAAAEVADTRHLITSDLDADNDVDLIFVRDGAPHVVLLNDRLWNYTPSGQHDALRTESIISLAALDLDADRQTELISADQAGKITIWQSNGDAGWQGKVVHSLSMNAAQGNVHPIDLAALDLNGNGRPELAILTVGKFEVIALDRNRAGQWRADQLLLEDYTGNTAIPVIRSTRGSSFIALQKRQDGAEIVEWAPGAGRAAFATLTLSGKHDAAETMRSNHSGIGSTLSVRTGSQWSVTSTHKHSSLRGYSLQPVAVGLGGQQQADFVAVDWSDGVYQTELDIPGDKIHAIAEEQRQLGSCPVLFAWNGSKFDFVTDILGVAAQGFLVEPGTIMPPRPWERVAFGPGSLASRDGRISFKVTEPMEENSFIDMMTLESYDLPPEWQLVVDERMATGAPEVTGETLFYRHSISPVSARDGAGNDVHEQILEHDRQAMQPGEIDRRYIGLLKDTESLTLEFDEPINKLAAVPAAVPVLVAESWVELPYSQTHFSAWQAGKSYRSVTLEAQDSTGRWHMVYPDFGMPAGMPRTMSLPLGELPARTQSLRLSWNREIYWDRVRIVYAEQAPAEIKHQILAPHFASVAKSGFYQRVNHPQRRPEYVYQNSKPFADVKYPTGFYTNLGEMTELLNDNDDALAIIGPGEEIHVEFTAPAPPAPGLRRWYVLDTRGWAKDKDMYTYQGGTVEPLPRANPDADVNVRAALHQKYNTRFQSGR